MDANRTTMSGGRLTMITGTAGQPVSRRTVEEWCETHRIDDQPSHHQQPDNTHR